MTQAEKYAWGSLVTTGLIFAWFQHRMLDGWTIVDQSPRELLGVFVITIVLFIIAESVVAGVLAARGDGDDIEKDERDVMIDMKAEQNASWFISVAIVVLISQLLLSATFAGYEFGRLDLSSMSALFFVLYALVIVATLIKRLSTLALYRLQSTGA